MTVPMRYTLRTEVAEPAHLRVALERAAAGRCPPHDYRMVFEAVPIDERPQLRALRLRVQLRPRWPGWRCSAYLATAGRAKIGFTVVGQRGRRPAEVRARRTRLAGAQRDALLPGPAGALQRRHAARPTSAAGAACAPGSRSPSATPRSCTSTTSPSTCRRSSDDLARDGRRAGERLRDGGYRSLSLGFRMRETRAQGCA